MKILIILKIQLKMFVVYHNNGGGGGLHTFIVKERVKKKLVSFDDKKQKTNGKNRQKRNKFLVVVLFSIFVSEIIWLQPNNVQILFVKNSNFSDLNFFFVEMETK